jgi:hypothetical protein
VSLCGADEKLTAFVEMGIGDPSRLVSDHVAAESLKKPIATRVDKVEHEGCIPGLDFEEKLVVAIDERLVFDQAGVGVNEHTPPGVRGCTQNVESKDQRELLIGSRVTQQVDKRAKKSRLLSVGPWPVIDVRIGGEIVLEAEAVARVERWEIERGLGPKIGAETIKISSISIPKV